MQLGKRQLRRFVMARKYIVNRGVEKTPPRHVPAKLVKAATREIAQESQKTQGTLNLRQEVTRKAAEKPQAAAKAIQEWRKMFEV
jgi:phage antirepressor YoqD-like protein